jgi:hypothetical protein
MHQAQYATSSQRQSEMPSLVEQLQQRHGLTKKKVYGVKPPRTPLVRDEPPSDPYWTHTPTPLRETSMTTPVIATPGGRSAPLSRLDRIARMSHRGPMDTSGRWRPCGSQWPSGDVDCPLNYTYDRRNSTAIIMHLDPEGTYSQPVFDSGKAYDGVMSAQSSVSSSSKAASKPKYDEPFTFDPEYILATAVMFQQEVLPGFPEYTELADSYGPLLTKHGNDGLPHEDDIECVYSLLPYLPASKAGQLFAAKYSVAACQPHPTAEVGEMPPALSESMSLQYATHSIGTSSLSHWAG